MGAEAQEAQEEKPPSITFANKTFYLRDVGTNAGGQFARYILEDEDPDNYTMKLGTLLCRLPPENDPVLTARDAAEKLKSRSELIFSELLTNPKGGAALLIFGYQFDDGEMQLNIWKYDKRPEGVFCSQVMLAAPPGMDATAFKIWMQPHKQRILNELIKTRWPLAEGQILW